MMLLLGSMLLVGCVDRMVYDTPFLRTRVVDAATGHPIAGASVVVWDSRDTAKQATGVSDVDGNVLIEPVTRQTSVLAPFDPIPPSGRARIEARGYKPGEIDVPAGVSPGGTTALSPVN